MAANATPSAVRKNHFGTIVIRSPRCIFSWFWIPAFAGMTCSLKVAVAPARRTERPRAGFLVRAAQRVGSMPVRPDVLGVVLRAAAHGVEVDAGYASLLHADLARDDHGIDVVAHAAFDDGLHRIAHGAHAQRAASREIDQDDVRARAGHEPAEVVAADGLRSVQPRRAA